MRLADIAFGIPFLPFVIVLAAFLEPSIWNVVLAMALVLWRDTARVIRSQVLTPARARLCRGGARRRLVRLQDHPAPHRAQHPAAVLPLSDRSPSAGRSSPRRPSPSWASAIRPVDQLGLYAAGCLRQPGARQAGLLLVRAGRGICIILVVSAGFFITRGYREHPVSEVGPMSEALLSVRDLKVSYRVGNSAIQRRRRRDLRRSARLHRRAGRGVRLRQDHGRPRPHPGDGRQRHDLRGGQMLFDGRDLACTSRARDERAALARYRLHPAERDELARSGLHRRVPAQRGAAAGAAVWTGRRPAGAARNCSRWSASRSAACAIFRTSSPAACASASRSRWRSALNPKLVIADEPVTALDVIVQRQILDQLRGTADGSASRSSSVTHDISVVAYICDRTVVMSCRRVAEQGPMAAALTRPSHPYTMGLRNAFPDLQGAASGHADADPRRAAKSHRPAARLAASRRAVRLRSISARRSRRRQSRSSWPSAPPATAPARRTCCASAPR